MAKNYVINLPGPSFVINETLSLEDVELVDTITVVASSKLKVPIPSMRRSNQSVVTEEASRGMVVSATCSLVTEGPEVVKFEAIAVVLSLRSV